MSDANLEPLGEWVFTYLTHELRTPLNALLGFSQMLAEGVYGDVNARQKDRLDRVVHSAQLLLRRLDLLLDYHRLLQGQLDFSNEHITLDELLEEALASADYDSRGRPLQVVLPEYAPPVAIACSRLWAGVAVREVLLHAASEANPDPTVWLQADVVDGRVLVLKVRFNAAPMDAWQQGNLFTVHNRTGIGLPVALELLSRMYGHIEYESYMTRHEILVVLPLAR